MTFDTVAADLLAAYQSGMRNSLFTGFLTLCGFLMSAKTFIVVNMKKEVYEKEAYLLNFDTQRKLDPKIKVYAPLNNLSWWLLLNVWASVVTTALQFTVGFVNHWIAAAACLLAAFVTLSILAFSLVQIRSNLRDMFHWLEVEAEDKITAAKEAAEKKKREEAAKGMPAPVQPDQPQLSKKEPKR